MKSLIIVGLTCTSLVLPSIQSAISQPSEGAYMETTLCTTGSVIRIPLGGDEDEAPEPMQACHALCSRDVDEDCSSESKTG